MHMALLPAYAFQGDRRSNVLLHRNLKISEGTHLFAAVYNCKSQITSRVRNELEVDKPKVAQASSIKRQLEALHSYFLKLQDSRVSNTRSRTVSKKNEIMEHSLQFPGLKVEEELDLLENYLGKLKGLKSEISISSECTQKQSPAITYTEAKRMKSYLQSRIKDNKDYLENSQVLQPQEDSSDFNLTCMLASINIGVFLFEIASPVQNCDLPTLYGAKINELILDGEWWRLVTPMFLHSGVLHVALGLWVLLTFGPQVSKGYGASTFFLIYMLGGIAGNLTSYLHTPEPTVGGTGPVFAIIGAWIIYQIQNKDATQKDVVEIMFRKAVIATTLSFVLSNFGPIDDWTHLGAVCVGVAYGYLTCPTLQLDESSLKTNQKSEFAIFKQSEDPLKSVAMFVIFLAILSTLLLFVEPQVNTLDSFM